jgi:hypothetical protein
VVVSSYVYSGVMGLYLDRRWVLCRVFLLFYSVLKARKFPAGFKHFFLFRVDVDLRTSYFDVLITAVPVVQENNFSSLK